MRQGFRISRCQELPWSSLKCRWELGLGYSSVGSFLPSKCKAPGLIPSTIKRREHEMAQQIKALANKLYNLSSISSSQIVEGDNQLPGVVLIFTHTPR